MTQTTDIRLKNRRRIVWSTLVLSWVVVFLSLYMGHEFSVFASNAFILIGSIAGFYIAGRTWQNVKEDEIGKE